MNKSYTLDQIKDAYQVFCQMDEIDFDEAEFNEWACGNFIEYMYDFAPRDEEVNHIMNEVFSVKEILCAI
jgi:hypothetical protein